MTCTKAQIVMLLEKIEKMAQKHADDEFCKWISSLKELLVEAGLEELDIILKA